MRPAIPHPVAQTRPEQPLKVAHVVLSLECGGLERIVLDLVRQGQRLGQQVDVICLERLGELAPQVESLGARLFCTHKPPGLRLRGIGGLDELLQKIQPQVIHAHQSGALLYVGAAARRVGVPLVVHTEHNNHIAKRRVGLVGRLRLRMLSQFAGRYAARVFCVSQDVADAVIRHRLYPRHKVQVVPNGIDATPFDEPLDVPALRQPLGIPTTATLIGTLGRLNEVKRQDLLIRAFARLHSATPSLHLLLVGDGPVRGELEALARSLGVSDAVHFAGFQPRAAPYLRAMDVFALTSRIEGMPLVVLEAWAAGVPVVASRVGGVPELIDADGHTGTLFPSGDEGALVSALRHLLEDRDAARRIAQAGRQKLHALYTVERMAGTYHRHYLELLVARVQPTGAAPLCHVTSSAGG